MSNLIEFVQRETAFANRLRTFTVNNLGHIEIKRFLNDAFTIIEPKIKEILDQYGIIKVGACFLVEIAQKKENDNENGENERDADENDGNENGENERDADENDAMDVENDNEIGENEEMDEANEIETIQTKPFYIYCEYSSISAGMNLTEWYQKNIIDTIEQRIEDFEQVGSGWTLHRICEIEMNANQYDVLRGASYMKLPNFLMNKKAIINIDNTDEYCFKWAVLAARFPQRNGQRHQLYRQHEHQLDFSGLEFPVRMEDINMFEKKNPSISINVYMYNDDKESIYPVRLTNGPSKEYHIHLLLLSEVTEGAVAGDFVRNTHYCWIKNLSRLLSAQVSKAKKMYFFCDRCLQHFTSQSSLDQHIPNCIGSNNCKIEMPGTHESIIRFKEYEKKIPVPFVFYADVESLLKSPTINFCTGAETKTTAYQEHEIYSIGFYLKCSFDESKSFYEFQRGHDCVNWFVKRLRTIVYDIIAPILRHIVPIIISDEEENEFETAVLCHICEKRIGQSEIKVRDHCHLTGKYRGAAHQSCNIAYVVNTHVPVVFHNLSGYDSHFIIREISTQFSGDISIIPINDQKYISFTKTISERAVNYRQHIKLRFIDSFRFMADSLDKLVSYLPSEKKLILRNDSIFKSFSNEKLELLERKGVFPYDYVDSWEKLNETRLPTREQFYSKLNESEISQRDYDFAHRIWNEFDIKTLGEYSDQYLKTDILLLADVFENFRETCMSIYKLDPAHFYTSPGYSWSAMLKYTKVQIELFTDIDMLLFIERGIRGGISQCSGRHFRANNKYMDDFDPLKPSSYLMYVDENNLYGASMAQTLPLNGFKWSDDNIDQIKSTADDSPTGYILEVDLEYPTGLHDSHKDYPLCAETRIPPGGKHKKLLLTLFNKKNYVIHYTMLKFVLSQGLILTKVHRVLKFRQSMWLRPYILLNTVQRTRATNDFEKNLYKLMSNAVYGKTMENLRNRVDIKLRTKWQGRYGAAQLIAQPNFKRRKIFDENLVAIEMLKTIIKMNKPIVIGMSVLDISKVIMYDFHYNYMKKKYEENVEILYTDTDSFVYKIMCEDFYADMKDDIERYYDTSDYPENNVYGIPRMNKKIPGKMKDENNGDVMTEFVGLRSKMYSIRVRRMKHPVIKKAKGVKKYVLDKNINFDDYLRCVETNATISRVQRSIRAKNHRVYTIEQEKNVLSPLDDKRYILANGIDTLPHGHFSLMN